MKNIFIVLVMILIGSPSFGSDLECKTLSKDNYKNFSMGFGISLGVLYMVGYNDGKNKNKINFEEKYMEKLKKLIVEGCSKNPDSDMLTLFREGMRDDFNNPNWGKERIKPEFKRDNGEVDGWKDYKFGMSIEEVNDILKDQCKGNFKVSSDSIKSNRGEPCFSIAGFEPNIEKFKFKNNKLVSIGLELTFTNDKGLYQKYKSKKIIIHHIKENEYEIFVDKIFKALKKKYGYVGDVKENDKKSYVAYGNGQVIAMKSTHDFNQTKLQYYFSLMYFSSNQAKQILIDLGIVKKKTGKIKTFTKLTIESLLLSFDPVFKINKLRKCWIKNLSEGVKRDFEKYFPELENIEENQRIKYLTKKYGVSDDELFEVDKIEKKCKQSY